jgi:hypothetical protein
MKSLITRYSVIGIETTHGLDRVGVRVPVRSRIFSSPRRPDRLWGPQPPIQWVLGALSSGVKRLEHEADHSPSSSAEVRKMWISISTPPYAFMS